MKKMSMWDMVAMWLVVVGGLNWGLVGLFKYNLVDKVFGVDSGLSRVIYILVGLSALWVVVSMTKMNKKA